MICDKAVAVNRGHQTRPRAVVRLEREHTAAWTDDAGHQQRVPADIGAHVDGSQPRREPAA